MTVSNPLKHNGSEDRNHHESHMGIAISAAKSGSSRGLGGPFGCVVVKDGQIIAVAHNTVLNNQNPTCHAEMNAIRMACKTLRTHDLSDCDLYTTCEPCPMCWGAIHWARIRTLYNGIDRCEAAKYGWSDEFYYTELGKPANKRTIRTESISDNEVKTLVKDLFETSPTCKRRVLMGGNYLQKVYQDIFNANGNVSPKGSLLYSDESLSSEEQDKMLTNNKFMREAVRLAQVGMSLGKSKEREPFGTVIERNGEIVGRGHNMVLHDYDPTATAEIVAITDACKNLGTHDLSGCEMYCTGEPDVMSMGAIYWANVRKVYIGYSLADAAAAGFEDGIFHYKELNEASQKVLNVVHEISFEECKNVFIEYQERTGTLY